MAHPQPACSRATAGAPLIADFTDDRAMLSPVSEYRQASRAVLRRRLFATTLTLLNAIAALARMGLRSKPRAGYSTPAAIGIPMTL
jgi:hypothetical protein